MCGRSCETRLAQRACACDNRSSDESKEAAVPGEKWNVERLHKEVYDARTKLFVIVKVLETGSLELKDCPEWALVIKPLLNEITENAEKIRSFLAEEAPPEPEP